MLDQWGCQTSDEFPTQFPDQLQSPTVYGAGSRTQTVIKQKLHLHSKLYEKEKDFDHWQEELGFKPRKKT